MRRRLNARVALVAVVAAAISVGEGAGGAQVPAETVTPTPTATGMETGTEQAAGEAARRAPWAKITRVTWQQALDLAATRNPSTLVAMQEIERADGLVREARAGWMPTLSGNGTYVRLNANRTFNGAITTPINVWTGNILLTVPILAPVAWANGWHARDNRDITAANAADVRRQLATAVGRTYLTVLLQHREVEVAGRARDTASAHYEYAHTRMRLGLGNGVDDARAEQELRSDEAQVKDAETALVRAQTALGILLSEEDLVDAVDDFALSAPPDAAVAVDDARKQRADVRTLQARREAAAHLRRDEWVYYAPSLLAQAQVFEQTATPLQPGSGWQGVLVLSIPFYDGGARQGIRREREATEEAARIQLEASLRQVSVEVRGAFRIVANADESLRAARLAATAAITAQRLAEKSYRAGATTDIEVVDAQRRARDADTAVALAEDASRQARLDLLLATGAFP